MFCRSCKGTAVRREDMTARTIIKAPIKKKTFCCVLRISFFFAFWTRRASLTIAERTQREMHMAGCMCTVKTLPF
jgi:hypothetical protein